MVFHLTDEFPHGLLRRLGQFFVRNILTHIDLFHLITEDGIGQFGTHGRNPILCEESFLWVIRPDHHVDVRMMTLIVESGVPLEVVCGYFHGVCQVHLMHHEQRAPRLRTVIMQSSGILPAQRVDDGPHISLMGFQFGHCRSKVNSGR